MKGIIFPARAGSPALIEYARIWFLLGGVQVEGEGRTMQPHLKSIQLLTANSLSENWVSGAAEASVCGSAGDEGDNS